MSVLSTSRETSQSRLVDESKGVEFARVPSTSFIHARVVNEAGEYLGTVLNLMINVHTGKVEYVVIQFGAFLGMGGKLFAIPFRQFRIGEQRGALVLNRRRSDFENMPGFDRNHWPDTNSHHLININALWNTAVAVQF